MPLFRASTSEEKNILVVFRFGTLMLFLFRTSRSIVDHEIFEDEWYVVIINFYEVL